MKIKAHSCECRVDSRMCLTEHTTILVDRCHAAVQLQYDKLFEQKHDPLLTILVVFFPLCGWSQVQPDVALLEARTR